MPSSSGFSRNLAINRIQCRRVPALIAIIGALACVSIVLSELSLAVSLVLVGVVLGIAAWECAVAWSVSLRSAEALVLHVSGTILLATRCEQQALIPVTVRQFWVLPRLMAGLTLADAGGRHFQVLLFRDQVDEDTWRRLLVRLQLGGNDAVSVPV
ncbi:MAG: protein YgfX [Gammaproteobacteria bacterium]